MADLGDILSNIPPVVPGLGPLAQLAQVPDLAKKDTKRKLSQVIAANWPGESSAVLNTARQVAVAESGGKPDTAGDSAPGLGWNGKPTSIGIFQVRGFDNKGNRVHAGKAGSPLTYNEWVTWAKDPDNNAKIAYVVYKEAGGFAPWTVYKTGAYKLSGTRDPLITTKQTLGASDIPIVGEVVETASDAVGLVGDFVGLITDRDTWFRIGKGFVGLNLITIGFVGLAIIALKDPIKAVASKGAKAPGVGGTAAKAAKAIL